MKSLNELRDQALRIATEHGFTEATIGEDVALMHSELSELLEDHRDGHDVNKIWYEEKIDAYDSVGNPILIDGKHASVSIKHNTPYKQLDAVCGVCDGRKSFAATVADRDPSILCDTCRGTGKRLQLLKPCGIPSEIADVFIRGFHFTGKHKMDIEKAVDEKMKYNDSRPYKHGKTI